MPVAESGRLLPGCAAFIVEELPLYEPSGAGQHLYVYLRKRDLTTDKAAQILAKAAKKPRRLISYAGKKDRHAITTQWFSIDTGSGVDPEIIAAECAELGGEAELQILEQRMHANKLQIGHLRGNRFRLQVASSDQQGIERRLQAMATEGFINRFGVQRFGHQGRNRQLARCLAAGELQELLRLLIDPSGGWDGSPPLPELLPPGGHRGIYRQVQLRWPETAAAWRRLWQHADRALQMQLSQAAQAMVANAVIDARQAAGTLQQTAVGEICLGPGGKPILVDAENLLDLQGRLAQGRLFTSAPLPGKAGLRPSGEPAACEAAAAEAIGLPLAAFAAGGPLSAPGARRACLAYFLEQPLCQPLSGEHCELQLSLPSGCYATEVLSQLGVALPERRLSLN